MNKITPVLWFDSQAEEAVAFYATLFPDGSVGRVTRYNDASSAASGRPAGSVLTVELRLAGQDFVALNGGPVFAFTPAVSLFVACDTPARAEALWEGLVDGGTVLMELGAYPFSEKYGWLNDRYGVSWQIFTGSRSQAITPALLFVGERAGKAEEAMTFYASVFPDAGIDTIERYAADDLDTEGTVKFAAFHLCGQGFIAMDGGGPHAFTFTPAISFMAHCATQAEVDRLWDTLSAAPAYEACGWLLDPYGVSWQIVPTALQDLMSDRDPARSERVTRALLTMKKLDIQRLQDADNG